MNYSALKAPLITIFLKVCFLCCFLIGNFKFVFTCVFLISLADMAIVRKYCHSRDICCYCSVLQVMQVLLLLECL